MIKLDKIIKEKYENTAGIVVLKNGETAYENYFSGCNVNSKIHVYSVTKSIISALIGIAIDKGHIESINQKILDFFPSYEVNKGEFSIQDISIKHLMTMTAPYKFKEEPYLDYFRSDDYLGFALGSIGGEFTGEFRYTPIVGPDILSGIIAKATGKSVLDFAKENLFSPLGINVGETITFNSEEEQFAFYESTTINGWVADKKGINPAGWGVTLAARDMAKIGQLYLNRGILEGKQIISADWIEASTIEHSKWKEMGLAYGYLWWVIDEREHSYAAMGDGGNVIYVNKEKDLVVAIANKFVPEAGDRIELIKRYIEPMFD